MSADTSLTNVTSELCDALDIPFSADDGRGVQFHTFGEALEQVRARTKVWSELLTRIEEVDPDWLTEYRARGTNLPDTEYEYGHVAVDQTTGERFWIGESRGQHYATARRTVRHGPPEPIPPERPVEERKQTDV